MGLSSVFVMGVIFLVPLVIGLMLRKINDDEFARWASYMTLKPLVATPLYAIWFVILLSLSGYNAPRSQFGFVCVLLALPGVALTIWITNRYAGDTFIYRPKSAWLLLVMDFLRWSGSSWMLALPSTQIIGPVLAAGLPVVFAITALILSRVGTGQKSRKLKDDFVYGSFAEAVDDTLPQAPPLSYPDTIQLIDGVVAEVIEDDQQLAKRKRE